MEEQMEDTKDFSLSLAQLDLWNYDRIHRQSTAYHVPMAYYVEGIFEKGLLKRAIERIIERYPVLKTRFFESNTGEIRQVIDEQKKLMVHEQEIQEQEESFILQTLKEMGKEPFDLEKGELARFYLMYLNNQKTILYVNIHHIIFDGMSIAILLDQIKEEYASLAVHREHKEPLIINHYSDFVSRQKNIVENDKKAYDFWSAQIKEETVPLSFPHISVMPDMLYNGGCLERKIEKHRLAVYEEKYHINSYSFFLSVYQLALFQQDQLAPVITLTPYMNRINAEDANEIGYFVNMLRLACDAKEEGFLEFVKRTQERVYEMLEYGYYPLQHIQREKKIRNIGNAVFYYQNWIASMASKNESGEGLRFVYIPSIYQEGEFKFVFEIFELQDEFIFKIRFDKNVFDEEDMNRFLVGYEKMVSQVLESDEIRISQLIKPQYRNSTAVLYDKTARVYDYIKKRALVHPDKVAIQCGLDNITYRELEERSEQLCFGLRANGIQSGDVAGVCMERSIDLIVSLLAIMKADAVYVPIDVVYPEERISYMIESSDMKLILSDNNTKGSLGKITAFIPLVCIEDMKQIQPVQEGRNRNNEIVYLLYTSGSTGKPKGVQIYHRGLVNALLSFGNQEPGFQQKDSMFAVTTVCFDIAELEMFLPLIQGGTVVFPPQSILDDTKKLKEELEKSNATVIQATPATLKSLLSVGWVNKELKILCGGEAMPEDLAEELLEKKVELWNMYGPTETTIWSTVCKIENAADITIGKPIANTQVYILNEDKKPVSLEEEGELYLSGDGVAKGYLKNDSLTKERFLDNPFSDASHKMYATGDIAKFRADGKIEYCGRKDTQVKIRGYRIELKEIEVHLKMLDNIKDAIVVAREEIKGKKMLTAFVIPIKTIPDTDVVNEQLLKWLPRYMVPVKYVMVSSFPKTLNQKYDRKQLMTEPIQVILAQYGYHASKIPELECGDILTIVMNDVRAYMQAQSETLLEIDINANIGEYGFDSITFVKFTDYFNEKYRISVNPTMFYSHTSVAAISKHLLEEYQDSINEAYTIDLSKKIKELEKEETQIKPKAVDRGNDSIAIVGVSGKFPQADDLEEFWSGLSEGRNMVEIIPADRWDWRTSFGEATKGNNKTNSKWGGFIRDVKMFDAAFFCISPREAKRMDPQQRLMLQCVWSAIEDAGHKMSLLRGSDMGVFIGTTGSDYMGIMDIDDIDGYTLTGVAKSVISNRISYVFDWHGPSESVDTACSSSLVALHRAVNAIRDGECTQAIAGGVNLILSPFANIASSKVGMLSPDGACKTFDESANGYVRGEGVACVYLKKLEDAVKDKDKIYALIKNTTVNHGGKANSLTAPNPSAQAELLRRAYKDIEVDIRNISYVETHGTGTSLGDPIEINGLKDAFKLMDGDRGVRSEEHLPCLLGSVKTNIGHLEAAAGIASVIKVLLSMEHNYIPGNIHLHKQNQFIDVEGTPFELVKQGCEWNPHKENGTKIPQISGVSSFGFGGVNAHVVLEEYIAEEKFENSQAVVCQIPVSAKTKENVLEYEKKLLAYIRRNPQVSITDVAFTMREGREFFSCYNIFEAANIPEFQDALEAAIISQSCLETEKQEKVPVKEMSGNRIPLPTYPFTKDEYWYDAKEKNKFENKEAGVPVIDENSPFVTDHIVGEKPIVPAALQIETIRSQADGKIVCLQNILFYKIITKENIHDLHIVRERTEGTTTYSIQSIRNQETYSQAAVAQEIPYTELLKQWSKDDFQNYQTGIECYKIFSNYGFFYQDSFQVIQKIWYEHNRALALLKLPVCFEGSFSGEELHPSLLDGALQSVLVLLNGEADGKDKPGAFFPFSIESLEMLAPLEKDCYVYAEEIKQKNQSTRHYNILITSTNGKELVQIKNYMIKKIKRKEILYFTQAKIVSEPQKKYNSISNEEICIMDGKTLSLSSLESAKKEIEKAFYEGTHQFVYQYTDMQNDEENVRAVFRLMKCLAERRKSTDSSVVILYVNTKEHENNAFKSACQAMLRSVAIEEPYIHAALIETAEEGGMELVKYEMKQGLLDSYVRYEKGQRICCAIQELFKDMVHKKTIFEKGDTVLIAGAGKLAEKLANYFIRKYQATIILSGRKKEFHNKALLDQGAFYIECDFKNLQNTEALIEQILKKYKRLDGIIDCAGIKNDAFLIKKEEDDFMDVVASKVETVNNIDQASKNCALRYFICYSSVTAIFGNIGQTDYAFGNGFLNGFCEDRNEMVKKGVRTGKSIAIDWCYWEDGGMQTDEKVIANMKEHWGVEPISDEVGIQMLEETVRMPVSSVLPVTGDSRKIRLNLLNVTKAIMKEEEEAGVKEENYTLNENLKTAVKEYLRKLISDVTGISVSKISDSNSFGDYGIDSVIIMDLNKELEERFGSLSKTLFFEYDTIAELADYFLTGYKDIVDEKFEAESTTPVESLVTDIPGKESIQEKPAAKEPEKQLDGVQVRQKDMEEYDSFIPKSRDIAIIGVSGLYPMAEDMDAFWENLCNGLDCVTEIPKERWDYRPYYNPDKGVQGKTYSKWGSFLEDIDKFDPLFFGISPIEAQMLDPQERLFIETVWHTMEDAGYTRETVKDKTVGVFVGVMWGQYQLYGANPLEDGTVLVPASSYASIANRVSYFFNFRGPSMALDTMCSSSLTSIHLACNSILSGESDLAIAGGVNLTLHPNKHIFLSQTKFAASDGKCHSFGEGGDGYVPGEAVGSILLKPLEKAIKDGDNIYAVIKGSTINHGGKANGYTVPNVKQQAEVISKAYKMAHVNPRTVNYIEAHGTGTALGDPIEISSMTNVFGKDAEEKQYCSIGSVKSNVGHCESASGIIGIIKILLQMKYKMIVPSIHSDILNPNINFENTPFYVQQKLEHWDKVRLRENDVWNEYPRRAAINSFGAGGSNAHILLEEYERRVSLTKEQEEIIVLSGKDHERLRGNVENLVSYLKKHFDEEEKALPTAQTGKVQDMILQEISRLTDIQINSMDQSALISEYLMTTVELLAFTEHMNEIISFTPKMSINDIIEHPSIKEFVMEMTIRSESQQGENELAEKAVVLPELTLSNISYTLQIGREAMKERIAVIAKSIPELIEKLDAYLDGNQMENVFDGSITNNNSILNDVLSEEDEFVNMLLQKNKQNKLAMLWVCGVAIPWNALPHSGAMRISLPGYDFRKDTCWLPDILVQPRNMNPLQTAPVRQRLFIPKWVEGSLDITGADLKEKKAVLYYGSELEHPLKNWILQNRAAGSALFIDLDQKEGLDSIILNDFENICYLSLNNSSFGGMEKKEEFERIIRRSAGKLFRTIQHLDRSGAFLKDKRFIVLSDDFMEPRSDNQSSSLTAGIHAFMKSFAREYYNITTIFAGLKIRDFEEQNIWRKVNAMKGKKGSLTTYLLGGNQLKELIFVPYQESNITESSFQMDGTYVIIGGSGNVGKKLCIYLAKRYKSNIVVIGRRAFEDIHKNLSDMVTVAGGKFQYEQSDITDSNEISKILMKTIGNFGTINGIFDLAMSLQYSSIQKKTEDIFYHDIDAKVAGSVALGRAIKEQQISLDFLCIFSSGEAFTGSSGWSTYALGCAFEDHYSKYLRKVFQIPAVTINWGFWDKDGDEYIDQLKEKGIYPLSEETGMLLLENVLASKEPQMLALEVEEDILVRMGILQNADTEIKKVEATDEEKKGNRIKAEELTLETVKDYIKGIFEKVLYISKDRFEDNVDFTEYGVDSIIIMDIHNEFENVLGKLIVTMIPEYSTFNKLARFLLEGYSEKLAELLGIKEAEKMEVVLEAENHTKSISKIKLIEEIKRDDVSSYLENYGADYQNGALKQKTKDARVQEEYTVSKGKMAHMLIETQFHNELEVFTIGEGKALLLIPAIGLTAPTWVNQLHTYADEYQLIVIHNPGYGMSTLSDSIDAEMVIASFREVLQKLKIEKVHIVGSCFGGIAAQQFAAAYPEVTDTLTLCGAFYKNFGLPDISLENIPIDKMGEVAQMVAGGINKDFDVIIENNLNGKEQFEKARRLLMISQCVNPLVVLRYISQILTVHTTDILPEIKAQTLCIAGTLDTIVEIESSRYIAANVQNGTFAEIDGAGHYPYLTHPNKFDALLKEFLKRNN